MSTWADLETRVLLNDGAVCLHDAFDGLIQEDDWDMFVGDANLLKNRAPNGSAFGSTMLPILHNMCHRPNCLRPRFTFPQAPTRATLRQRDSTRRYQHHRGRALTAARPLPFQSILPWNLLRFQLTDLFTKTRTSLGNSLRHLN